MSGEVQQAVAQSADAADLHAPVPTLLLELQTLLGSLSATVTATTERGRRPFRPGPTWPTRLGELAYGVYLLADQTGVDVEQVVASTAANLHAHAQQTRATKETGWPFDAS
ncbi:MAG TPA: hypothetical protein VIM17_10475 [Jatrophihabitantaceae bacterium]